MTSCRKTEVLLADKYSQGHVYVKGFIFYELSLEKLECFSVLVPGQYLVVSGGDDSALYAAEFDLVANDHDTANVHVIRDVTEPSAHTSSVTGSDVKTTLTCFLGLFLPENEFNQFDMALRTSWCHISSITSRCSGNEPKISRKVGRVLNSNKVHFVSLTNNITV